MHRAAGVTSPTGHPQVRLVVAGARRRLGTAQRPGAAGYVGVLRQLIAACPDTVAGARDRAALLVGFAGAFRRSELAAFDVSDLEVCDDGLRVLIRRSKTDQEAQAAPSACRTRPNLRCAP